MLYRPHPAPFLCFLRDLRRQSVGRKKKRPLATLHQDRSLGRLHLYWSQSDFCGNERQQCFSCRCNGALNWLTRLSLFEQGEKERRGPLDRAPERCRQVYHGYETHFLLGHSNKTLIWCSPCILWLFSPKYNENNSFIEHNCLILLRLYSNIYQIAE